MTFYGSNLFWPYLNGTTWNRHLLPISHPGPSDRSEPTPEYPGLHRHLSSQPLLDPPPKWSFLTQDLPSLQTSVLWPQTGPLSSRMTLAPFVTLLTQAATENEFSLFPSHVLKGTNRDWVQVKWRDSLHHPTTSPDPRLTYKFRLPSSILSQHPVS